MPAKKRKSSRLKARLPGRDRSVEDRSDIEDARARMEEKGSIPWAKVKKDLVL